MAEHTRPLPTPLKTDDEERTKIATWIVDTLKEDLDARKEWNDMRLQRYAKFRVWLENKDFPWPNASNARVTSLMEDSLRTQDTLHNAVMASRPVCTAQAIQSANRTKQDTIDAVIDWQIFVEQKGEVAIGQLLEQFTNDSVMVAYLPWIRDEQEVIDTFEFEPPKEGEIIS